MFGIIAFFCFLAALFNLHLGTIDMVVLGLMFMALQMVFGGTINIGGMFNRRQN